MKTDLSIPLNQTVSLTGGYSNGFLRFGTSEVLQDRRLIDSNYQTYTAGLSMKASPQDVLSVNAVNYENTFTTQPEGSFTRRGGTVAWEHTFSPFLTMKSHAGVTSLQREVGGVSLTSTVAPVGGLALFWKDRTTSMAFVYNFGVAPSLQFQAEALRTNVVSFTVTQETSIPKLLAVANLNYGRGDQFGSSSGASLSYVSVMGTGGVVYKFSPETFLGLNYSYSNVENNFGGNTFGFDRHVVQLSLTQAFY
jgi:hypothetical protein